MCMEDIRIGRAGMSQPRVVAVGAGDTVILPYNPNRVALVIAECSGNLVWTLPAIVAAANAGIPLIATSPPLVFTVQEHGQMVCQEWHAIASVATNVVVIESVLDA